MKRRFVYQVYVNGSIYSSRIKAHNELCRALDKDEETYLPTRETLLNENMIEIAYTDCHAIYKLTLN